MSGSTQDRDNRTRFDGLGSEAMIRINQYCDRFESLWQQNKTASLAEFLATVHEVDRNSVLPELVLIDLAYRQKLALPISAELYPTDWTELDRHWLDEQLSRHRSPSSDTFPAVGELTQLGDYRIEGKLGAGGMGQVYRATHKLMGRVVAIKVLKENLLTDHAARRRFEREVRTVSKLSHPNIVAAFDAREDRGALYLVTEYVEGEDLSRLVSRKGPLKPAEAMQIVLQAAKGLKFAHSKGIVHRDIKPANLLIEKKRTVKVLDLGLARLQDRGKPSDTVDEALTQSHQVVGTASYMAPEQARSPLTADERSDIYSLGCTLFYLLTGHAPYRGETFVDTILAHSETPTPDLPESVNGRTIDPELRQLATRMIAKSPEHRPQTMNDVVNAIAAILKKDLNDPSGPTETANITLSIESSLASEENNPSKTRIMWFAVVSMLALVLIAAFVWRAWIFGGSNSSQDDRPNNTKKDWGVENLAAGNEIPGLRLDGEQSYVEVREFAGPPDGAVRIEVAAVANDWQDRPANLVTWTGDRQLALFISYPRRQWGIAYFDGNQSRLVVSQHLISLGQLKLFGGEWNGSELRLYEDGVLIPSESIDYPLSATNSGLFIGGVPDGILRPDEVRFFDGVICGVRISAGKLPTTAKTVSELTQRNDGTLASFSFSEGTGAETFDASSRRYRGDLHHSVWTTSAGK